MAYELRPREIELPSPSDVVRLLQREFAHVHVDHEDGLKQAISRAEWIERAPADIFLGQREQALEHAAKLRNLSLGEALTVEVGDDALNTLRTTLIPGEDAIRFGFGSNEEQVIKRPIVERCARVLQCDTVVI
jgi:DNA polymerase III delta prime subunit